MKCQGYVIYSHRIDYHATRILVVQTNYKNGRSIKNIFRKHLNTFKYKYNMLAIKEADPSRKLQ